MALVALSNPVTRKLSGTENPASCAARQTPAAMLSLAHTKASGRSSLSWNAAKALACLDFIIMFIYAVRIERDAMFAERIPVGKKTLLIFLISDDSADIIELCTTMISDQMFHQSTDCMVFVNS